ncbi:uncharacterized protein PV09_00680 [Verruconis gallopava]|uniref:Uncharacterized protein n=1 Tax=Verruconis gallopava TaxID=253628 RepID=A0A0D1Y0Y0_9PEZI|nr:uncharacterized protein PV09_00680 [Verruconis gallopava]KIW08741.1 hypothetical protein PV09_00680 [Verruconis gallopava]
MSTSAGTVRQLLFDGFQRVCPCVEKFERQLLQLSSRTLVLKPDTRRRQNRAEPRVHWSTRADDACARLSLHDRGEHGRSFPAQTSKISWTARGQEELNTSRGCGIEQ